MQEAAELAAFILALLLPGQQKHCCQASVARHAAQQQASELAVQMHVLAAVCESAHLWTRTYHAASWEGPLL